MVWNPDNPFRSIENYHYRDEDGGLFGEIGGQNAANRARNNAARQSQVLAHFADVVDNAPTAEDLTVAYEGEAREDEYGDLLGGPSELEGYGPNETQREALRRLQGLSDGGLTQTDLESMRAARNANAQQVGAMNRAAVAAQEARGMGGSGSALAAQLAGSQGLANANAQRDATQLVGAQARGLQALQSYGQMGMGMYDQEAARRQALDAFNQHGVDWRRQRSAANTVWGNRSREADARANQAAYQNWATAKTNLGNMRQTQMGGTRQDQANQSQAMKDQGALIGGTIQGVGGGMGGGGLGGYGR